MTTAPRCFELTLLPERYVISEFTTNAVIPEWATQESWFSFARTSDELGRMRTYSRAGACTSTTRRECFKSPRALCLDGDLCVSALASALAETKLSWFTIFACDTDYLLVASEIASAGISALAKAGHKIHRSWKE